MAAYNKFFDFVEQVLLGKHLFNTHAFNIYLSNAVPSQSLDLIKSDLAEISAGFGYAADGASATATMAEAAGTATVTGTKVVFTAAGGSIGPFQYAVLMNVTQATPLKPLVAWWDYGSALTLLDGETFSVLFNSSPTTGTIFTLT